MEEMFKDLDKLEDLYNKGHINTELYYQIKSKIIDSYRYILDHKDDLENNLPF